ncbi:hypothetical protein [Carboxydothermus pertinax]|uniref:Uncharacterized protein n=1 Tax=Carboxydothermus pertinax TaxID=870242 RepID=A0A1L8CW19_9THEO|nr:hypothetical protein [Carboxydothermus pertinax]GAV23116.1 hypothetical protein cpu_16260 [Carboxydothermus pertinax]
MKKATKPAKNEILVNLLTSIFLLNPELAAVQLDSNLKIIKLKYFVENFKGIDLKLQKAEYLWKSYLEFKKTEKYILKIEHSFLDNYVMIEVSRDLNTFQIGELSFAVELGKGLGLHYLSDEYNEVLDFIEVDEQQVNILLENTKRSFSAKVFAFREEGRVVIAN